MGVPPPLNDITQINDIEYNCTGDNVQFSVLQAKEVNRKMPNYKKILDMYEQGISQRQIASIEHVSRHTVSKIINGAVRTGTTAENLQSLSDLEIEQILGVHFEQQKNANQLYEMPDYEYYAKELKKPGVTITLLWEEYVRQCLQNGKIPYQKTQFNKYFHDHIKRNEFTDIIKHKPGESIEVDWAGTRPTGQIRIPGR